MEKLIESQNKSIKKHLLSGRTLTPLGALNAYRCFRLSARIYDLKKQGLNIEKEMVEVYYPSTLNGYKRVARYRLVK